MVCKEVLFLLFLQSAGMVELQVKPILSEDIPYGFVDQRETGPLSCRH